MSSPLRPTPPKRQLPGRLGTSLKPSQVDQLGLHVALLFDRGVSVLDRTVRLVGEVDGAMFSLVDSALTELEAQGLDDVTIRINSLGGDVYDALAIVGRMRASPCRIITEGYGAIMSAASLILAAGAHRRISKFAWYMVHGATYDVEGRHSDVKAYVRQMEVEDREWAYWMSEFTKRSQEFWKSLGSSGDTYYKANDLVGLGVVDEVF